MRTVLILLALLWVAAPADAASYTCTNGRYKATGDITLSTTDTVSFVGTATARCAVLMGTFRFILSGTVSGNITLTYADVLDCGDSDEQCFGGSSAESSGTYTGTFAATYTTWTRSGAVARLTCNTTCDITFNYNDYDSTNVVPVPDNASNARPMFLEGGSSTNTKEWKGNRLGVSWFEVASPNWVVGIASGSTPTSDSNIAIGKRIGLKVSGTGSTVRYNYFRGLLDVTPAQTFWSQVNMLHEVGSGVTVEHNIFRQAHWVAQGINGTLSDNVLMELHPHQYVRIGEGGSVHHNIMSTLYPGPDQYAAGGRARIAHGDTALGFVQSTNNFSVYNNTIDARGKAIQSLIYSVASANVDSWRSNVAYQLTLVDDGSCAGGGCTEALGQDFSSTYSPPVPERMTYSDYNDTYFASASTRKVVYGIRPTGLTVCDDNAGQHDLGTCDGQGSDPVFKGPLPIGSGQTGTGGTGVTAATFDSGFPFNDADIRSGLYTVSAILSYFRWVYAPDTGSPLLSAQDPADGTDHMGAVRIADIPGSAPTIASANTPPMVWAGPSFTIASTAVVATLGGYGADDGTTLTFTWAKIAGPGTVTFGDSTDANTTATFGTAGVYTLRLTASDGTLSAWQDVQITVS